MKVPLAVKRSTSAVFRGRQLQYLLWRSNALVHAIAKNVHPLLDLWSAASVSGGDSEMTDYMSMLWLPRHFIGERKISFTL